MFGILHPTIPFCLFRKHRQTKRNMIFSQRNLRHALIPVSGAAITIGNSYFFARSSTNAANTQVHQLSSRMIKSLENHPTFRSFRVSSNTQKRLFSNSSEQSVSSRKNGGFVQWYEGHLTERPIITKATTGSILWGLGDVVAQVVPSLIFQEEGTDKKTDIDLDVARTGRAMFYGFAIHAPLSHLHFNLLEWMTIKGGFVGNSIPVFKTVMEQFVYWSWFSNSLYHGAMGAMQGMTLDEIQNRISSVLWDTQKAQWAFWIPIQMLNFKFVPVRHQLNVVLLTSVAWTALLSAWYPPEKDDAPGVGEEKMER
jgi:protein Mpv17